jgi:hypothetical protein
MRNFTDFIPLINDASGTSDCIVSNGPEGVISELDRVWMEAVVA